MLACMRAGRSLLSRENSHGRSRATGSKLVAPRPYRMDRSCGDWNDRRSRRARGDTSHRSGADTFDLCGTVTPGRSPRGTPEPQRRGHRRRPRPRGAAIRTRAGAMLLSMKSLDLVALRASTERQSHRPVRPKMLRPPEIARLWSKFDRKRPGRSRELGRYQSETETAIE
jgi:hypothetical protein